MKGKEVKNMPKRRKAVKAQRAQKGRSSHLKRVRPVVSTRKMDDCACPDGIPAGFSVQNIISEPEAGYGKVHISVNASE